MRRAFFTRLVLAVLSVSASVAQATAQREQYGYERALDDLSARVQARTGAGAQSCANLFQRPGDRAVHTASQLGEAITCVRRLASVGAAGWFVSGGHGLDSWVAEGLLVRPYGAIERFTYDSDPGGGGGVSPGARFDTGRCFGGHVYQPPGGGFSIECLNDPWRIVVQAAVWSVCAIASALAVLFGRRSWRKTAASVLAVGVALTVAVVGQLASLGGLRVDLAMSATVSLLAMGLLAVRVLRSPTTLAA